MLTVDIRRDHDTARLVLGGELDLDSGRRLAHAVADLDGAAVIELDLRRMTYCDSSGIAALMQARTVAASHGASLHIANPHGMVRRVLELCGVLAALTA